jgi:hypothetical protein
MRSFAENALPHYSCIAPLYCCIGHYYRKMIICKCRDDSTAYSKTTMPRDLRRHLHDDVKFYDLTACMEACNDAVSGTPAYVATRHCIISCGTTLTDRFPCVFVFGTFFRTYPSGMYLTFSNVRRVLGREIPDL